MTNLEFFWTIIGIAAVVFAVAYFIGWVVMTISAARRRNRDTRPIYIGFGGKLYHKRRK